MIAQLLRFSVFPLSQPYRLRRSIPPEMKNYHKETFVMFSATARVVCSESEAMRPTTRWLAQPLPHPTPIRLPAVNQPVFQPRRWRKLWSMGSRCTLLSARVTNSRRR